MTKIKISDKHLNCMLKCFKLLGVIVFCGIMGLSVRAKMPGREILNSKEVISEAHIPNPIKKYDTLKEVRDVVGYDFMVPTVIPKGYKQDSLTTIGDKIVSISYTNGKYEMVYRTAQGKESLSGDYNKYPVTEKIKVGDNEITIKGNNNLVYVAEWTQANQSFSITSQAGIEKNQIIEMIKSVTPVHSY